MLKAHQASTLNAYMLGLHLVPGAKLYEGPYSLFKPLASVSIDKKES